jgi:hypothetical protein
MLHLFSQDFDNCVLDGQTESSTKPLDLPRTRLGGQPEKVSCCYSIRWSPDGSYLAISTGRRGLLQMWYVPHSSQLPRTMVIECEAERMLFADPSAAE